MSDRFHPVTRDQLRTRIETTIAHTLKTAGELTADTLAAELQADADEMALLGFQLGLVASLGPQMGAAAFADLTGTQGDSDAELARRFGLTRAAVSKTLIRIRRNLDYPARVPGNARPNRKPANPAAST